MVKSKMPNLYKYAHHLYTNINSSKLFAGLAMIILNIFSKYVVWDLSKSQEAFIKNTLTRELLIFIIAFVGTRDIVISILISAAFIILSSTIFNEKSKFCVIPKEYKQLQNEMDINKDGSISDQEITAARKILNKANIERKQNLF